MTRVVLPVGALTASMLVVLGGFQGPASAEGRATATARDAAQGNEKRRSGVVIKEQAATDGTPAKGSPRSGGRAAPPRSTAAASSGQPPDAVHAGKVVKRKASTAKRPPPAAAKAEPALAARPVAEAKAAAPEDTAPAPLAAKSSRLETADSFALLAGSTITNAGVSTIEGDVGLHPGSAVTGFESCTGPANCVVLTGAQHLGDASAEQAQADVVTAYDSLVGLEATCTSVSVELGGSTLLPGVYCSPTFGITGTLTLDGNNLVAPEFVFLTGSGGTTLITAVGSNVLLVNGADACNVYWQVGSSATLGASSSFAGNILAAASISFGTGATLNGSALAQTGAVTLDNNTITNPACGAVVTPPPVVTPPSVVTPSPVVTPPTGVIVPPAPVIQPSDGPGRSPQAGIPGLTTTGSTTTGLTSKGRTTLTRSSTGSTATGLTSTGMTSSGVEQGAPSGPGLPVTGATVQQELLLAGMAMAVGSLMVLLSKPARRRSRTGSIE